MLCLLCEKSVEQACLVMDGDTSLDERGGSTVHGWAHMDILPCFVVLVLSHEGKCLD